MTAAPILVKAGVGRNIEKVEESNLAYEKRQASVLSNFPFYFKSSYLYLEHVEVYMFKSKNASCGV